MGSRLGRRVVHFANLPIKLLMPSSFSNITEISLKTIPSASKIEIKRVLESLYGFEVEKVRTLNMEGKKKKRGGLLVAKPDYKKAYVTLRSPLSISQDLYPIRIIEEDRRSLIKESKLKSKSKSSIVEEGEAWSHWLDKKHETRFIPEKSTTASSSSSGGRGGNRGGDGGASAAAKAKFPWTSMRSSSRYYSDEWLHEDQNRVPPHRDEEVTRERNKCFKRYFEDITERTKVITEFGKFSGYVEAFSEYDSIHNRWHMDPYTWWCAYGAYALSLQKLALRLLVQPASSSCCERNWSTYSFIHSVRRNKMVPQRAEDLVFIHSNLRLLSRRSSQYLQGETKMWDIAGDNFDSLDDIGMLGIAKLSLDEPAMEAVLFTDEGEDGGGGEDVVIVSST